MASVICDDLSTLPYSKHFDSSFNITKEKVPIPTSTPPPPPRSIFRSRRYREKSSDFCCIPKETRDVWDRLFKGGYGADVYIITEDQFTIPAHLSVLNVASPVLGKCLQDSKPNDGLRYLKIHGVPHGAVCTFIRFLYSSCYEEEDMKKYAIHLLVLSHSFVAPLLKKKCLKYLEKYCVNTENVIDVLQLARLCDAPRLSFICVRMAVRNFKCVTATEAWSVMRLVNPALERELLGSLVEVDARKDEKAHKIQEKKVYSQLHQSIEALIHICKDGCSTIGPQDKVLKGNQGACGFSGCKGIEMLVRHFFGCKIRVPGGCFHCKRMWQLLELHSVMCDEPESCNVPLCRHFKEKMRKQTKKDLAKWRLLVRKVMEATSTQKFADLHCNSSRSHQSDLTAYLEQIEIFTALWIKQ